MNLMIETSVKFIELVILTKKTCKYGLSIIKSGNFYYIVVYSFYNPFCLLLLYYHYFYYYNTS